MLDPREQPAFNYRGTYDEKWPLPRLCVEVLSPGQPANDEQAVLADYLAMGVENIWLIDPIYRAAFTFDAAGLHEADPTALTVPNTPIHVDLTEAFAALDRA